MCGGKGDGDDESSDDDDDDDDDDSDEDGSGAGAGAGTGTGAGSAAPRGPSVSDRLKPLGKLEVTSRKAAWAMYPRRRLEIDFSDIAFGIKECFAASESDRPRVTAEIEKSWAPAGKDDALVTLSVRTGFDAVLRALQLPRGSEVAMSAVSIHDMVTIVEHHGLQPVPVDLDPKTLAPRLDLFRRAITPRTRVLVVAHVFGTRNSLDDIVALAHEHGILVIDDCAEAFIGPDFKGSPNVDVSLFSFGTIKTTTAFGAGMMRIADTDLRDATRRILDGYPARSRAFFLKRLVTYSGLHAATTPALYGALVRALNSVKGEAAHDQFVTSSIRGFTGGDLLTLLRQRPSMPLLKLLQRRLDTFDRPYLEARVARCKEAAALLQSVAACEVPGLAAEHHAFWLFPVMVPNPKEVCRAGIAAGYDVTQGATQLGSVDMYVSHATDLVKELRPVFSRRMMTSIVYLPINAEMSSDDLHRLVDVIRAATAGHSKL